MPLSLSARRAAPTAKPRASRAGALPEQTGSARDSHPGMPARRAEEERLRALSLETEARAAGLDYAALLRELDATCADGVTDAPAPAGP